MFGRKNDIVDIRRNRKRRMEEAGFIYCPVNKRETSIMKDDTGLWCWSCLGDVKVRRGSKEHEGV